MRIAKDNTPKKQFTESFKKDLTGFLSHSSPNNPEHFFNESVQMSDVNLLIECLKEESSKIPSLHDRNTFQSKLRMLNTNHESNKGGVALNGAKKMLDLIKFCQNDNNGKNLLNNINLR